MFVFFFFARIKPLNVFFLLVLCCSRGCSSFLSGIRNRCDVCFFFSPPPDKYYHKAYSTIVRELHSGESKPNMPRQLCYTYAAWNEETSRHVTSSDDPESRRVDRTEGRLPRSPPPVGDEEDVFKNGARLERERCGEVPCLPVRKCIFCAVWSQAEWSVCLLIRPYVRPVTGGKVIQSAKRTFLKKQLAVRRR